MPPEIDASIPLNGKAPTFDPLATVGKLQDLQKGAIALQQGQLQTRILGQQANANQPSLEAALRQAQIGREQVGLTDAQWQMTGNALLPLIQKFGKAGVVVDDKTGKRTTITPADVSEAIGGLLQAGGLGKDPNYVTRATAMITALPTNDPKAIMEHLYGAALMSQPTPDRIAQLYGQPTAISTGGETQISRTPSLGGGGIERVGGITNTLSPAEASTPTPLMVRNSDGTFSPSTVTRAQYTDLASQGPVASSVPLSRSGLSPEVATAPVQTFQNGQPGVVSREALAAAPGFVPNAPALGQAEAAQQNVDQAMQLQKRAAIVPQRRAALSELVGTLDSFEPGPRAELTGQINGLAAQFHLPVSGATSGKAAQDTFNKLAAQIALDQWGTLGGSGSNEQLATSVRANPHDTMSKMGIKNVVALLQGNEDAIAAQNAAWQKYSKVHGPSSYGEFITGWNRHFDPRAFQADHMATAAVKTMEQKMTAKELAAYKRARNFAEQVSQLEQ